MKGTCIAVFTDIVTVDIWKSLKKASLLIIIPHKVNSVVNQLNPFIYGSPKLFIFSSFCRKRMVQAHALLSVGFILVAIGGFIAVAFCCITRRKASTEFRVNSQISNLEHVYSMKLLCYCGHVSPRCGTLVSQSNQQISYACLSRSCIPY